MAQLHEDYVNGTDILTPETWATRVYTDSTTKKLKSVDDTWAVTTYASTDLTTLTGEVIFSGSETIAAGGTTTALSLTKTVHDINADAGWDIFTLADGTAGQIIICVLKTATWVATITPATFLGGTSVTLNAAWDTVMFVFQTTLWWSVIGGNSYTIV